MPLLTKIGIIIGILAIVIPAQMVGVPTEDLYKKDKLEFIEIGRIDEESIPESLVYFNPYHMAENSRGELYVPDIDGNRLLLFNRKGKFIKAIGQKGQGPGDLLGPYQVAFNGKYMYVWETRNRRLSLFDESGTFNKSMRSGKKHFSIKKLKGLVNGKIVMEHYDGQFENELSRLCFLQEIDIFNNTKEIYSHPIQRERYVPKVKDDVKVPFGPRVSWDVSFDGRIIAGYQGEYTLHLFNGRGEKISTFSHASEPIEITEKEKKDYHAQRAWYMNGQKLQRTPRWIIDNTVFPKYKPFFYKVLFSADGHIWVFLYGKEPGIINIADIFSPAGKFINRVAINVNVKDEAFFALDDTLWVIEVNEDEERAIVHYKFKN